MILGTGLDIVEVARIKEMYEKFGERLLHRILRPSEIAYCLSHKNSAIYLAARFSAKEAVSKAFGTGIGRDLGWQDIEILRKDSGEPCVRMHGKGLVLLETRGAKVVHLTLSHTQLHAVAMAILES